MRPGIFECRGRIFQSEPMRPLIPSIAISLAALLLMVGAPVSAEDGRLLAKHQAVGQTCASCHREEPARTRPGEAVCFTCHGDQAKLAAVTAKADPNPHA